MIGNRSANTYPERVMREALKSLNIGHFTTHAAAPGTPDIAYETERVAVFVHGCYWHRCPYCSPNYPSSNQIYWSAKFERNKVRDRRVVGRLREAGWQVVIIWECILLKDPRRQARRINSWLRRSVSS